jgi:virginiamycin B lyase
MIWTSFWTTGEVGRYDPNGKSWKVWPLPNSGSGCYAVYVDSHDKIWLTDFNANAIVRFDPDTEKFDSFTSTRHRANVRQLSGRPGEVWGAESGVDRLVVVREK